jgi:hypothetical protein
MKKALVLGLICVLALGFATFATTSAFNFVGAGIVNFVFASGDDAVATFNLFGNNVTAAGQASDADNNPYGYGVDNTTAWLDFSTTNGGGASLQMDRVASYVPMYGPGGQVSLWEVYSSNGTASLVARDATNYAGYVGAQYGFQNDAQLAAAGTSFYVLRQLDDGNGDEVSAGISGNGSGILTTMNNAANGAGFTTEGGTGCYENNSATMSGASTVFVVQAVAQHAMSGENFTSTGATTYLVQVNQQGGTATINDWWVAGN